jgi:uncharacterized protein (DUF2344 family)
MLDAPETVRIRFCKVGNLQFISHLDLQRTFHRVLVRAAIPMWYTKGFNPHAKLVFGVPLSVGTESMCEMADLKIERKISLEEIKNRLIPILDEIGLPSGAQLDADELYKFILRDKKASGENITVTYVNEIGKAELRKMPIEKIKDYL